MELLRERTEGWPAGLQLAALSLRDRPDRHRFVRAFAGDDRQIGEYLHEVLEGQPRPLREFLLRTSILERLCAPLCDKVTGDGDAGALLAEAYRSNLFLVALDERATGTATTTCSETCSARSLRAASLHSSQSFTAVPSRGIKPTVTWTRRSSMPPPRARSPRRES